MAARQSREVTLAVSHRQRTGCTPGAAAARYGVAIESSDLIGLIPQQAMFVAAAWYLHLDNFSAEQVLENNLLE